jgi:hypothetical protein
MRFNKVRNQVMQLDQLIELVKEDGWKVAQTSVSLQGAEVRDGHLVLVVHERDPVTLPTDGLVVIVDPFIRDGEPDYIRLRAPRPNREQRKNAEGGGWHEVMRERDVCVLVNRDARVRNDDRQRQFAEERDRLEKEALRLEQEAARARLQAGRDVFVGRVLAAVTGQSVSSIEFGDSDFVIVFANGRRLILQANKEDYYDPSEEARIEASFDGAGGESFCVLCCDDG